MTTTLTSLSVAVADPSTPADGDAERLRLLRAIEAAQQRAEVARARSSQIEAEQRLAVTTSLIAALEELTVMERQHRALVAEIRAAAAAEAAEIIERARRAADADAPLDDPIERSASGA